MSNTLEYNSKDESSQSGSLEYHSGEEPESDRTQIILVNRNEEFTFLNIQFPMPSPYPHLYIQLSELVEPSQYRSLLNYYNLTQKQLQDALAQEWLELQKKYGRYLTTNDKIGRASCRERV